MRMGMINTYDHSLDTEVMADGRIVKKFDPNYVKSSQPSGEILLADLVDYAANDLSCGYGTPASVGESYDQLSKYHDQGQGEGYFAAKIEYLAEILRSSEAWPFPPIEVNVKSKRLYNGHHRSNAAIKAGWTKPIPITQSYW